MQNLGELRIDREEGFTLVEMMVTVLIIGILASIAIPAFLNQRKNSVDAQVQSDVKSAVLVVENWIVSHPKGTPTQTVITNVKKSEGTTLTITGTGVGQYIIQGTNPKGNNSALAAGYSYDSTTEKFSP
jgi:type IV pilus assembly protein PilA